MLKLLLKVRLLSWLAYLTGSGRSGAFNKKKAGKGRVILFAALYIYLIAVFVGMFFAMFSMLAPAFYEMGFGWFYFCMFLMVAFALMFIFSVFTAKSQLFEARDNELLLSMPIPPSAVLGSRMASMLLTNLGFELVVAAPAAVAWCIFCPVNAAGAVSFVLVCLALPFFGVALSSFFGWILALLTAKVRRKSLVSTVFSLCFLAVYFYIYSNINVILQNLITNSANIAASIGAVTPLYRLGTAMAEGDIVGLIMGLACLIIPFVLAYIILSKTFIRTATTKRGAAKVRYVRREAKVASAFAALLRREWTRLLSSSTYIMNCALGAIMNLVLAVILIVKGGDFALAIDTMGGMADFIDYALVPALCVLAGMTTISACSVSLEGKHLWIVRSMPVESGKVLMAKLALHLLVSVPGMLLAQLAAIWVFDISGLALLWVLLIPQVFNVLISLIGLWANLKFPKLEWQNETQAVKQGVAVMIPIFGSWGILILPVAAGMLLGGLPNGLNIVAAVFLLLVIAASVLLYKWCMSRGVRIFERL